MKNSLKGWSQSQRSGIWSLCNFEKISTSETTGCHLSNLVSLTDHCDFILHLQDRHNEPSYQWDPMCALWLQPFQFRIRAKGQSSVTASYGMGCHRGKMEKKKEWNMGQGDLCGVKVFDNLSELGVDSLWIVRLVKACKWSKEILKKKKINHGPEE